MESTEEFARRFLQTAVVVDDEAYMAVDRSDGPKGDLEAPGRHSHASSQEVRSPVARGTEHTLNARSVIDSFAALRCDLRCGWPQPISDGDDGASGYRSAGLAVAERRSPICA